jgi:dCMP deaminase
MKIGLTGTPASGKTVVAEYFKEKGFIYTSLGDEIRNIARERGIEITRTNLQDLGNQLRNEMGGGAIAEMIVRRIDEKKYENVVVDSIRNPCEIGALRKMKNFSLIVIDAPWTERFERMKQRNRENDPKTLDDFFKMEKRDAGEEDELGQQVGKCMGMADFYLFNYGEMNNLLKKVDGIYSQILMKNNHPSWDEFYLGLAKKISERSKDPSTQVGAIIVRPDKSVCSVGFNGFPKKMEDKLEFYSNREEKYSRIIHAEINALTFSRDQSHEGYTLYTWPFLSCDRCFVQMVQAGIAKFVAPKATQDLISRWGTAIDKVKQYAKECEVEIIELDNSSF